MVEQLRAARPDLGEADIEAVAKLDFVLVQSLGIPWLLNPDGIPSGDELARAVAVIAATPRLRIKTDVGFGARSSIRARNKRPKATKCARNPAHRKRDTALWHDAERQVPTPCGRGGPALRRNVLRVSDRCGGCRRSGGRPSRPSACRCRRHRRMRGGPACAGCPARAEPNGCGRRSGRTLVCPVCAPVGVAARDRRSGRDPRPARGPYPATAAGGRAAAGPRRATAATAAIASGHRAAARLRCALAPWLAPPPRSLLPGRARA